MDVSELIDCKSESLETQLFHVYPYHERKEKNHQHASKETKAVAKEARYLTFDEKWI
jgi:hypothetical protein